MLTQAHFHLNHQPLLTLTFLWYWNNKVYCRSNKHFQWSKWMLSIIMLCIKILFEKKIRLWFPLQDLVHERFSKSSVRCPVASNKTEPFWFSPLYIAIFKGKYVIFQLPYSIVVVIAVVLVVEWEEKRGGWEEKILSCIEVNHYEPLCLTLLKNSNTVTIHRFIFPLKII